jgi:uncharacterized protein (TIGR03083 family)
MSDALQALRSSVDRLARLVAPLDDDAVSRPAYPSKWAIADVLSHLGSGAVISRRLLDDTRAGAPTPSDFNAAVWDEWNAKSPRAKADDGLAATRAFTESLEGVPAADRAGLAFALGPFNLDWDAFVRMRLNEHVLHEWDVAVALDPTATLPGDGTEIVIDNLDIIVRFSGKPAGDARTVTVATVEPERALAVTVDPAGVVVAPASPGASPDLTMPAEAFVRLVYGRLDPDHTPTAVTGDDDALNQLRAVFPGP